MSNEINWIIELLKITPSIIIGLIAALIAWQQAEISKEQKQIAQAKLKLDLFLKRLAVYEEVSRLVDAAKNLDDIYEAAPAIKRLIEISHETTFLFGYEVNDMIKKMALAVTDLAKGIKATAANDNVVPEQVLPLIRRANEFFENVDIESVFRPYLDLSQWK